MANESIWAVIHYLLVLLDTFGMHDKHSLYNYFINSLLIAAEPGLSPVEDIDIDDLTYLRVEYVTYRRVEWVRGDINGSWQGYETLGK
jgi:hypothetical protein